MRWIRTPRITSSRNNSLFFYVFLCLLWVPSSAAWCDEDWFDHLRYFSEGDTLELRLRGRFHYDFANIDADNPRDSKTTSRWRRTRLGVSAEFLRDWRLRYEYDFAADQDSQVKDAWIGYYGLDGIRIRAGNTQVPQSLEELTSSNAITFMERALPNALVQGYRLGLQVDGYGQGWTLAGGLFEGSIRGREDGLSQGWGLAGRATLLPFQPKWGHIHLGLSAEYREPPGNRRLSSSARPEVRLTDRRLVATGTLSDVDYTRTGGLEFAILRGPFSLQGEYLGTEILRTGRKDVTFDGWYLFGSWFLFGGQRNYDQKDGTFNPVVPTGRFGALEAAMRYSELDLQDKPITGGEERNWTFGLNWYVNRRMRFVGNWVHAKADPNRDGDTETLEALQLRLQLAF